MSSYRSLNSNHVVIVYSLHFQLGTLLDKLGKFGTLAMTGGATRSANFTLPIRGNIAVEQDWNLNSSVGGVAF